MASNSILLSAAMQPLSGSAGRPADQHCSKDAEQSDQHCSMDASKLKVPPVDSSAVQPAHHFSDADGETITGDGSHKGDERKKEAAKPKAPPPSVFCAECGQPCGYPHGVVHWSKEEDLRMRVPICGPICLMSHDSNALWRADNGDCEDQQTRRWTPNLIHEQLSGFINRTHFTFAEVDVNSDVDVGSARTVVDHSAKTNAEQPDHDCEFTVTSTTANQQRRFGYRHEEVTLVPWETSSPTLRPHEYGVFGYNHEQATPVHSPDLNSASSVSGQSRVERPAYDSQGRVASARLSELLEQRYQKPGCQAVSAEADMCLRAIGSLPPD